MYVSPVSGESDMGGGDFLLRRMNSSSNLGSASPAESVDSITPRIEKTFRLDGGELNDQSQGFAKSLSLSGRAIEILTTFKGLAEATRFILVRILALSAQYMRHLYLHLSSFAISHSIRHMIRSSRLSPLRRTSKVSI